MKFSLILIILFAFIGCASIPYDPVTNPDQRILFEGLSFYPPSGENWEVRSQPMGGYYTHETFGRALGKIWPFKKRMARQNQTSGQKEKVFVAVFKHEFVIMNFDYDDDLMEFSRERYKTANELEGLFQAPLRRLQAYRIKQWWNVDILNKQIDPLVLESNLTLEKFKGINCVKKDSKEQSNRWEQDAWVRIIIYSQGYSCVHPRHPNHIIQFYAAQKVLENQTLTDIQNELDHFFNSLEVLE